VLALTPFACTFSELLIFGDAAPGAGTSVTYVLRTGSSLTTLTDTPLFCTVSSGESFCSGTGAVEVAANSVVDVAVSVTGTLPSPCNVVVAAVCQ
jgi:hypothetical protein